MEKDIDETFPTGVALRRRRTRRTRGGAAFAQRSVDAPGLADDLVGAVVEERLEVGGARAPVTFDSPGVG